MTPSEVREARSRVEGFLEVADRIGPTAAIDDLLARRGVSPDDPAYRKAFGVAKDFKSKLIGDRELNQAGLHVYRMLLANENFAARADGRVTTEVSDAVDRDGVACVPEFLPAGEFAVALSEIHVLVQTEPHRRHPEGATEAHHWSAEAGVYPCTLEALAAPHRKAVIDGCTRRPAAWAYESRVELLNYHARPDEAEDNQTVPHTDALLPTFKWWLFLEDVVSSEKAPFHYARGTNRIIPDRLAVEYLKSVHACATGDISSFRYSQEDLSAIGAQPPSPVYVKANTLVLADTRGIHCRGVGAAGLTRLAVWGMDPRTPLQPRVPDSPP
jgi:hypothetical protein